MNQFRHTISDSNGTGLGQRTMLRGGATIACPSTINIGRVPTPDVLEGSGFVNATVNCSGVLSPGIAGADETGQLNFFSSLAMQSGAAVGRLYIDLAGTALADRDLVVASGPVTAAGTLKVRLINGFVPPNGLNVPVLQSAASVLGTFASEDLPPRFHTEYTAGQVRVVFCAADFNNDGFVDGIDYDEFNNAFEGGC